MYDGAILTISGPVTREGSGASALVLILASSDAGLQNGFPCRNGAKRILSSPIDM